MARRQISCRDVWLLRNVDGTFVFHYSDASLLQRRFSLAAALAIVRRKYPLTVEGRNLLQMLRTEFAAWLPKLTYIKVDAEGYDRAILASIMPVLRERRPVIRTEVFRKLMASERYALFDLLTVERISLPSISRRSRSDRSVAGAPRYDRREAF